MLEGFVDWPADVAARYRDAGVWEGITVGEMVARTAVASPDKVAVVHGDRRVTYAQLMASARRLALGLWRHGLLPGDRVVLQLPNSVAFVETYLALTLIGAIPVMALRAHRLSEVRHFIRASEAKAYVITDVLGGFDYRELALQLQAECPSLTSVLVDGDPGVLGHRAVRLADLTVQDMPADDLIECLRPLSPSSTDVVTMLLSGGTTSVSKLIPRTHDDYVLNARLCSEAAGFDADTVLLALLPLGHNYNLASPGMLGVFYRGATLVIGTGTAAADVFALIERERVSVVAAVVPLISAWVDSAEAAAFDLSSLKVVQNGGARLAPALRDKVRQRFGCVPQEIYGTAEGLINMTRLNDADDLLLHSSGAPVSELDEIRVLDDDDNEVADGELGELVTRGPYTIRGYYRAPEKNAEAFLPGGWYRMGDIVRRQGRHVFTEGRRKDLINRGGEKISCDEIENLIFGHPKVKSVVLVAMPDPVFGEKACACVIPKAGQSLAFAELIDFLKRQGIASFKLPERLEVMSEFPVSPVGKIIKRELRDWLAARLEQERRQV